MKNGWHTIQGREVFVKDGYIIRGIKNNLTAHVYRRCKNGWIIEDMITPAAFSAGVKRGTVDLF